mmetsp:Transcript_69311/g.215172  ORF Transcript_69311/g.215172 Transcript_69311/m.215172 type:complete len:251 (-) Transcript_69311:308-1060(-)
MSGVWKAPAALTSLACRQPGTLCARAMSLSTALRLPAQAKPPGKSTLAMRQTSPSAALSSQSCSTVARSRPATESRAWGEASAASCMASARSFTTRSPASKLRTPAAVSAAYSPSERPAMAWQRATASGRSLRSFSMAARSARNMAGWQSRVWSSTAAGPRRQSSMMSMPRTSAAFAAMACTAGKSCTPPIIFTYCEPWPGKSRAMEVRGRACPGAAGASAGTGTSTLAGMKCSGFSAAARALASRSSRS